MNLISHYLNHWWRSLKNWIDSIHSMTMLTSLELISLTSALTDGVSKIKIEWIKIWSIDYKYEVFFFCSFFVSILDSLKVFHYCFFLDQIWVQLHDIELHCKFQIKIINLIIYNSNLSNKYFSKQIQFVYTLFIFDSCIIVLIIIESVEL